MVCSAGDFFHNSFFFFFFFFFLCLGPTPVELLGGDLGGRWAARASPLSQLKLTFPRPFAV